MKRALVCLVIVMLLAVGNALFGCGGHSPTHNYAVATNYDNNTLGVFVINATTGSLTEIGTSPHVTATTEPWAIATHPNGKWIYVGSNGGSTIQAFSINTTTGALTSIGTVTNSFETYWANGIAISGDGKFLISADVNSNLSIYSINQNTGALAQVSGSPFATPSSDLESVVIINNKFVYAGDDTTGDLYGFIMDTNGALTPISGSPWTQVVNIHTLVADQTGRFVYAGMGNNTLYGFSINQTTGVLTPLASFPVTLVAFAGSDVEQMVFDPSNRFMYVADDASSIQGYSFDSVTGALTAIAGSPFAADHRSQGLTIDPSGKFLYSANDSDIPCGGDITAYSINPTTGALTAITGSPYAGSACGVSSIVVTH